jgi:hypothetical protein
MADKRSNPESITGIEERKSSQGNTPARLFQYGNGGKCRRWDSESNIAPNGLGWVKQGEAREKEI